MALINGADRLWRRRSTLAVALIGSSCVLTLAETPRGNNGAPAASSTARNAHLVRPQGTRHSTLPPERQSGHRDAMHTLRLALASCETQRAIIAHNLANADTPGYKQTCVLLEDADYHDEILPGAQDVSGQYASHSFSVGAGSRIAGTTIDFRQGPLRRTGRELDLAIRGAGFFQMKDPSGEIQYCRAGRFSLNANGQIVAGSARIARLLEPAITVPSEATKILVDADGTVSCRLSGNNARVQIGTIQLARFVNPQGLRRLGENQFGESASSGAPQTGSPGANSFGKLRQGSIEASNVNRHQEIREWKGIGRICKDLRAILEEDSPRSERNR